ncbi:MAG: hypothetical protein QOC81_1060 [Thermoanaerobaculia bacterium]|jgi:hypothetical protein|nr:hypothetical protein [Thermoanaerobaculia bacterium]
MVRPAHAVIKEIMRYFVEHPHALDSLEGVARWRLLQRRIDDTVSETESALEWLVANGYLQRVDVTFGPSLFRIAAENPNGVERLLAEETS